MKLVVLISYLVEFQKNGEKYNVDTTAITSQVKIILLMHGFAG